MCNGVQLNMEMLQVIGISLIGAFFAMILKEQKPNLSFLLVVFIGSSIFLFLVDKITNIVQMVEKLAISSNVNMLYFATILKVIGIAYIAEFASQITKDAGQAAISSKIEFAGKIIILTMAIPILTAIIESVIQLVAG
ncbi:MAG: spoIIIAD [Bacillales bacterium]|jgi:stage III sporulation protein AD|nr:spoIIIAD [Bacillales bacterium]